MISYIKQKCSVDFIFYLKYGAGKKDVFMKIDIDDLLTYGSS